MKGPYKGLAPFEDSDDDALLFFGRERERAIVTANLRGSRLTVLYGETGVGKSSLLRAGVVRELRRLAPRAVVEVHSTWSDGAERALATAWDAEEAYVILDQFEEYFLYHGEDGRDGALGDDLPELLRQNGRVNVLISLRDDTLARLNAFKTRLPAVFANQVRLDHLDRAAARDAIVGPLRRWNELTGEHVDAEPELVDAVLEQAATGGDRVEAPYLQLVMERIWDAERAGGSQTLRLATLRELGGAETVVREHVDGALALLDPGQQDVAERIFGHLVTPSGTKIAHRPADLADYAGVDETELVPVLAALDRERIVRSVDGDAGERYEIFHDVLAEPVRAWRARRRLEVERAEAARRQRRLRLIAAAALFALGVLTALTVYSFTERSAARSQARTARARELDARALQQLDNDPSQSLALALEAARLEPGPDAESVLRPALALDRLRLVVPTGAPVSAVAFSRDDRLLAAAAGRRTVLYDTNTGKLSAVAAHGHAAAVAFGPGDIVAVAGGRVVDVVDGLTKRHLATLRHGGAVRSVAFDETGRFVLTAGADGMARVWAVPSGRLVRTLRNPGPVAIARFGGARLAATVAADVAGRVRARVFDLRTGKLRYAPPERGVSDVEFAPVGHVFATTSHDGGTRLYDTRTGRRLRTLRDGDSAVLSAAFDPSGKLLATAGGDGGVRIWRVADYTRLYVIPSHVQPVGALAWSPSGQLLADASRDRYARLLEVTGAEAGSIAATLAGHTDAVTSVAFSPDGTTVATGSADGTARVWDARAHQELTVLGRHGGAVLTASFDARGTRVVSVGNDAAARIWDVATERELQALRPGGGVADARFSPDGSRVATASSDGSVTVWDTSSGARVRTFRAGAGVGVVRFSPDGRLLAAGSSDGRTTVWRVADGTRVAAGRGPGAVVSIEFAASGRRLLAATVGGVALLDLDAGRTIRRIAVPGRVARAALAPDGSLVATAGADGRARLYDVESGRLVHRLAASTAPLADIAFSPDGSSLLTTGRDGRPSVWNVETGARTVVLIGHIGPVETAAYSPDGRWIVTGASASAGVWPTDTGRILFYLRGDTKPLTSVSFAADSRRILSSSEDGTVRVYDCDLCVGVDALVALGRQRLDAVTRFLDRSERERYLHP